MFIANSCMFVDYTGLPERPVKEPMGYFLSKIKQVMKNIKSIIRV